MSEPILCPVCHKIWGSAVCPHTKKDVEKYILDIFDFLCSLYGSEIYYEMRDEFAQIAEIAKIETVHQV